MSETVPMSEEKGNESSEVIPMPAGWNEVDKLAFGRSTNFMSLIFFGMIVIAGIVVVRRIDSPTAYKLANSVSGTTLMFLLAGAVFGLNLLHLIYERDANFTVLENENNLYVLPLAMSAIGLLYFMIKTICITDTRLNPLFEKIRACDLVTNGLMFWILVIASIVGIVFVSMRTKAEEENNYENLNQPVPELPPL